MFIDTHAHLQLPPFDVDRDAVIQRAIDRGVIAILTLATDRRSSEQVLELADRYPIVYAGVGVHPCDVAQQSDVDLKAIHALIDHPKVVAIGETGIDCHWDCSHLDQQKACLRLQLSWAMEKQLPLIIHNRKGTEQLREFMPELTQSQIPGVFHCFDADSTWLNDVLTTAWSISFAGNLTYPKSPLPDFSRRIPLDRLLLETDSPYLPPVPYRGQRNEPAYIEMTAKAHAAARGFSLDEIANATTKNARRLFKFETRRPLLSG